MSTAPQGKIKRQWFRAAVAAGLMAGLSAASAPAATLLDDSFADGDRTSTNLPSSSPVYVGQTTGNGSNTPTTGGLVYVLPSNSLKTWTYFTSNNSAPDGNQPHNAVTQLAVGERLTASLTFTLPAGATSVSTSKNFRFGLFFDPTDARVQTDANSDSGGATNPWGDATGYAVQMPFNGTSSGANPFTIGKRTSSANTSLLGSNTSYTNATSGGGAFALAEDVSYTAQIQLDYINANQMDVTARVLQGSTVLSSHTVTDTGTAFGTTAVAAGGLPGSTAVYTNFDQLFFRNSDNTQATELTLTNINVQTGVVPEPASAATVLVGVGGMMLRRRRTA